MQFNFDEVVDRKDNNAAKYDELTKKFGTDQVIPLWIADMDFRTAPPIIDALTAKANQGIFGYVSRPEDYFASIARWQQRRNGWAIPDTGLMSFAVGVVPALAALVRQLAGPGEAVLIQPPVYPEFFEVCENSDRAILQNRLVEQDGRFQLDREDFARQLEKKPKAFILCNPHNPTGHAWTREELAYMGEQCLHHGVTVISDEIHGDLMLFGHKHTPMASLSPQIAANTITCTAPSKTFNLAGLQMATVIFGDSRQREAFEKFWHSLEIHRNSAFSLVASMAAYNQGEPWLEALLPYLEGNMRFVKDFCDREIPKVKTYLPDATYLMWMDCRGLGLDDAALAAFMIQKAGLGLNAGNSFDPALSGYMRLNTACPRSTLEKAMGQLRDAVNAL